MKLNAFDRFTLTFAPRWTLERVRSRAAAAELARTYEAASQGRRTSGWARNRGDVNAIVGLAGAELRLHARDLLRNNSYTRKARQVIAQNVVGWGIVPKPSDRAAAEVWKRWSESTECDADGRLTFAGLQDLVMRSLFSDGEVLIRRRIRRAGDGLAVPLQLQILEADFIDTSKNGLTGIEGGPIKYGVEFDAIGRRVAYWLFPEHPGAQVSAGLVSRRVPASEIQHVFDLERAGQVRGVSWLGSAIVNLKDLDEYEDAELMRQKIAACFAAFITDTEGGATPLGTGSTDARTGAALEAFEPGMIAHLPPGKGVTVASPPAVTDASFTTRNLRKIAAGLSVTYEDLTGDYSQVNFSSARMGRIVHQGAVRRWQNVMLIPQFCAPVWEWFSGAASLIGAIPSGVTAEWTAPPLPMIEPDKETLAATRAVRAGLVTPDEMIREQGGDPESHWQEYADALKRLDALGIKLDSDVRATSQAGLTQERVGGSSSKPPQASDAKPTDEGA